ncbi:MAG: DEAD/DEAH box helicase, partial [Lachnospiraceae bacterium]|nr:DEAD/DEAH box helicase [Lachnospiraceae bacterium]
METMRFDELDVNPQILRGIREMGFEEATPIQSQAIPVVLSGVDVIGQAQTGTGKTAAFGIPILQKVDPMLRKTQVLILSPTRELAIQVADEIRKLAKYMHGVKVLPVYGGQDISRQIKALKGGVQIIISTPGRLMDHLRRKTIRPDHVHTIVLDEADEMLNMGFREDIETVLEYVPQEHQTVLFSATMPKPILDITRKYQHDAVTIKVVKKELTVANIDQYYYDVKRRDKVEVLCRLLDYHNPKLSLVFCNTKKMVDELAGELTGRGYSAEGLHGDMKQSQRDRVMQNFRKGKTDILIATDVAARGIDVDDVEAVFNYDLPQDDEYYVHRIGRTGRAGRTGKAFSFVKGKEVYKLKDIQRYCKTKILAQPIPSSNDVAQIKAENILERIGAIIEDENLDAMIDLIEQKVNESDYTAMDMAAAFLNQAMGNAENSESPEEASYDFENAGAEDGMVRLFVNIGRKQNVKPGDILGAIAGESGMPG